MTRTSLHFFSAVLCTASIVCAAEHHALLPAPHEISYGNGSVSVCRIAVEPPSSPNDEDSFTLQQINALLKGVCSSSAKNAKSIRLVLERTGNASTVPGPADVSGPQSREAYQLSITPQQIRLHSGSSSGLFYAFQTLRQLIEYDNGEPTLPEVQVADYPSFAYRGFMMDLAHGGVLTEDEVKRQLDFLARWKANQYYFYAETTIELPGYPLLKSNASWSPQSIRRIIAYARERHIDVVPCVELYGHLHDLFREERYSYMAGLIHGGEINPRDPDIIAITEDWLRKLAALFPSSWVHIGLDEPWELERADPSIAKPEQFYLDHLRRMSSLAVQLGKRPMFWADVVEGAFIFKKYPELYSELPREVIAVPWYYAELPDFSPLVKPFADNHVSQMIATGIANWESVSTDFQQTFSNIDDFTAAGREYKVLGMINTAWADSAQAIYRNALPAIAYGAVAAWQSAPIQRNRFFANYATLEFPNAAGDASSALEALSTAQALLTRVLGTESMFRMWDDPFTAPALAQTKQHISELHQCRLALEEARLHLDKVKAIYPDAQSLNALSLAVRMVDFAALKYIYASEIADSFDHLPQKPTKDDVDFFVGRQASARNHSRIEDLMDEVADLRNDYETEWRAEYRPFRLQTALGRWNAEFEFWRSLQSRAWESIRQFDRDGTRPDLTHNRALP